MLLAFGCCAGMLFSDDWEKDNCPELHSLAWCVVKAQAISPNKQYLIQDAEVTPDQYKQLSNAADTFQVEVMALGGAVAVDSLKTGLPAQGLLKSALSDHMMQSVLGVSLLDAALFHGQELNGNKLMVWLPTNKPITEVEQEFLEAYLNVIKDVAGFEKLEYRNFGMAHAAIGVESSIDYLVAEGGPCKDRFCTVLVNPTKFTQFRKGEFAAKRKTVPSFLNLTDAYTDISMSEALTQLGYVIWNGKCEFKASVPRCESKEIIQFSSDQLALISARLPSYVWIYEGIDKKKQNSFPFVLNKGKPYYFVSEKKQ